MKYKTSVSFDENTIDKIRELVRTGSFRNKSHVVEFAVNQLFESGVAKNE